MIESGAGPHIGGDISDGDRDDVAAGIGRIVVGNRVHGVVVVLGVGRVDGDEWQRSPILAAGRRRRLRPLRLGQRTFGKNVRNGMGVDGD